MSISRPHFRCIYYKLKQKKSEIFGIHDWGGLLFKLNIEFGYADFCAGYAKKEHP